MSAITETYFIWKLLKLNDLDNFQTYAKNRCKLNGIYHTTVHADVHIYLTHCSEH